MEEKTTIMININIEGEYKRDVPLEAIKEGVIIIIEIPRKNKKNEEKKELTTNIHPD